MKVKNLWVSTYPRCASFWVRNIIKEIFKIKKFNILPDESFIDRSHNKLKSVEFYEKNLNDSDPKNVFLFKNHRTLKNNLPRTKIISVIRDPREIIISNMRFFESNFQDNLKSIKYYKEMMRIYSNYSKEYILILRYENILKNPKLAVDQIIEFIGLEIPNKTPPPEVQISGRLGNPLKGFP